MIQIRSIYASYYAPLGSFAAQAGVGNPCDWAAATHQQTGQVDKPFINLTWTAPDKNVGSILFLYTVVQNADTFWVNEPSSILEYLDKINKPIGCGSTVSCIMPRNCSQNCQYSVQWRPTKNNTVVEFEVKRKTSSPNYYMALGFSEDLQMGHDSVTECVTFNGVPKTLSSYNTEYGRYKNNTNLAVETFGVTMLIGDYINGVLTCKFERRVSVLSGAPLRSEDSRFFDLSYPYFLLIAHGNAYAGNIYMHSEQPDIYSAEKIDFLGGAKLYDWTTKTQPVPDTQTGKISRPSDCGKVYSCFHDGCKGGNCDFMLTWKETGDDILFSLACKRPQNAYCAIGLSKDKKMGDDSVFECVAYGDKVSVFSSYNDGRSNSRLEQPQFGLTDVMTSSKDGVIICKFKRKKVAQSNIGRKKRAAEGPTDFFNLNEDFTLFYAYGSASSGYLMKHSVNPLVSDQVADFQAIQEIGGTRTNIIPVHKDMDDYCGSRITLNDDHQLALQFAYDYECKVTIETTRQFPMMMLYFKSFSVSCLNGNVTIRNQYGRPPDGLPEALCGNVPSSKMYTSDGAVKIKYNPQKIGWTYGSFFTLIITLYSDSGTCPSWGHVCDNGWCIDAVLKCNGYNSCGNKSGCLLDSSDLNRPSSGEKIGAKSDGIVVGVVAVVAVGVAATVFTTTFICCRRRATRTPAQLTRPTAPQMHDVDATAPNPGHFDQGFLIENSGILMQRTTANYSQVTLSYEQPPPPYNPSWAPKVIKPEGQHASQMRHNAEANEQPPPPYNPSWALKGMKPEGQHASQMRLYVQANVNEAIETEGTNAQDSFMTI
ncbi:uncharacterized protein LOC127843912 isoform X2 [Dreissena polymorpha]|nr:uncharacterized protein LOC127843912 isoform X2 [Dreissena polymorpha]